MYVDALMMCPQKFLAVKSTPMVINAIMQNHPRIKVYDGFKPGKY